MKRKLLGTLLAAASLALAGTAFGATHQNQVSGYTDAEVRKVDKAAGKVTLKHGPIANLEMPPMTMVFRVKDAAVLESLKEGDKVKFKAEKVQGSYIVTELALRK